MIEHTSPAFLDERQPLKFQNFFFKANHTQDNLRCSFLTLRTYDCGRVDQLPLAPYLSAKLEVR